jgi:hypothetical protein
MQDTSANPYMVRLHSTRLVNAYTGDLRLAGSRRNTQEDRGEEQKYKVTVKTADPLSLLVAGTVGAWFAAHHANHVIDNVTSDVGVLKNLKEEAEKQRAKSQKELKQQDQKDILLVGKTTSDMLKQNHQGGVLESFGAAAGKFLVDAFSQKREDLRKALKDDPVSTQPKSVMDAIPTKIKADAPKSEKPTEKADAPEAKK